MKKTRKAIIKSMETLLEESIQFYIKEIIEKTKIDEEKFSNYCLSHKMQIIDDNEMSTLEYVSRYINDVIVGKKRDLIDLRLEISTGILHEDRFVTIIYEEELKDGEM